MGALSPKKTVISRFIIGRLIQNFSSFLKLPCFQSALEQSLFYKNSFPIYFSWITYATLAVKLLFAIDSSRGICAATANCDSQP
jgi:hypothetical protein